MRVAVLFEYDSLNGGERSWLATVPFLQSEGIELCGVAPAAGQLASALTESGVEHIVWPHGIHDESGSKRSHDAIRRQIREVVARWKPDLIHANSLSMARTLGPLAADLPVACIGHLRDIIRLNPTVIRDLNSNGRLLAVSHATREHHIGQGLDATKTHVLYNGVDLELFRPGDRTGDVHRELGISADARLILTIGQIGLRKGLDVGLSALRDLFASDESLHWLIVGRRHSGKQETIEYERDLVAQSEIPPFRGRVHWLGLRSDVPQLMRESSLLLHLARQEPFGRVLLEAAATAMAVVATDVGGTLEIFGPAAARIVPAGDTKRTIDAIFDVLSNMAVSTEMGVAARDRVSEAFSSTKAASCLLEHYRECIAD